MPGSVSMMTFLRAACFLSLAPATPSISSIRPLPTPSSLTAISYATLTHTEIEGLPQQKKSGQNSRRSETVQLIGCACSGVLDRSVASREFWQRSAWSYSTLSAGWERKKPNRASDAQLCGWSTWMDDTLVPRPGGFDILFICHVSRLRTRILEVVKTNNAWIGGWAGGWMDGWMNRRCARPFWSYSAGWESHYLIFQHN